MRAQSAMEYLMTYGWSILIIAVILGALAYLGVFNPLYFAPKANPGSCQAFRPNGAGTSYDINLLGVCNGELPQYVAEFNGKANVGMERAPALGGINGNQITVTAWVYISTFSSGTPKVPIIGAYCNPPFELNVNQNGGNEVDFWPNVNGNWQNAATSSIPLSTSRWYFIGGEYNGSYISVYLNDERWDVQEVGSLTAESSPISVSNIGSCGGTLTGYLANIQIYNASLDSPTMNALYQEGIGGAPIDLQNLVGWWPLNGNANDYSGNGDNGVPTNVVYTRSWISSYNQP